ncbi:MAG: bifunctional 5,10-methylenetetrahydrofolate dehydrogenase/5,10-methenyltetrahydrofolate cyclohydrolase [Elusimicrobia bacterium]|nr:bifunctional 5,10-methylenetetrahydrofolate dehydrogenase/5,10-methenyltetrahydrofolate cyclohydrolase [Elusimicrobiota bacterium]
MSAKILDGQAVSKKIKEGLTPRIEAIQKRRGSPPLLALVTIGEDPSAQAYQKGRLKACQALSIATRQENLPAQCSESDALLLISDLAQSEKVDGILLEQPLPQHLSPWNLLEMLLQEKDVEGVTPQNFGLLFSHKNMKELESSKTFIPCTAYGILKLLREAKPDIRGMTAVVVGRSNIVGKPTAHLLSCMDATVILCHSKTVEMEQHLKSADIVVSAVGKARWLKGEWVKPGAIVLDAGINYEGDKMVGDVDFESASQAASYITPVPGGVGPMTVAMLLSNLVTSAERRTKHP